MKAAELCLKQNPYIFTLNKDADLDGNVSWNQARFINHSCEPNCEAEQDQQDRIWIVSTRPIRQGEELTYNYGYDLKNFRKHPCGCGAATCLGYIVAEDLFPTVRLLLLSLSPDQTTQTAGPVLAGKTRRRKSSARPKEGRHSKRNRA